MRVLITRPREESEAVAKLLAARGIEWLIDALLDIRPSAAALPLTGVQALAFTSANGVRAFAAREPLRALPVFAVGEHTAEAARAAGFARVESAQGAAPELARLLCERLDPSAGAVLHCAGAVVRGELAPRLAEAGLELRRAVLYEAVPAAALAAATRAALAAGALDAVLFFSPRSAQTFVSLARAAGLAGACARLAALALSPAVAEEARALAWRELLTAARPAQAALLALLTKPRGEDQGVGSIAAAKR